MRDCDVLILGAGVIGLATAHALLREGRRVTVVDRIGPGAGASHGNCGTITPSHAPPLNMPGQVAKALRWMLTKDAPFYVKPRFDPTLIAWLWRFARRCTWADFREVTRVKAEFMMRARDALDALITEAGLQCEFERKGTLYVFRDPRAMAEAQWLPRALGEVNIPIETWDGARCRAAEPVLRDEIVGGFFNPVDAHLRPDRYVAELARVVRAAGGEILDRTEVRGAEIEGGRVARVITSQADFRPREIVFALGAWSPLLARHFGVDHLPIQPGKGYSITFDRPTLAPSIPLVLKERSVCVTAWSSGYRLGSTMEFAGYDDTLNRARLDALTRGATEYLREPVGPVRREEWFGWRPMTHDDLPVIGRAPRVSNLVLATGHGMLGVTMSALTARLVAEIVCQRPSSLDLRPYRVERFS